MRTKFTCIFIISLFLSYPLVSAHGMAYNEHERLMMDYVGGVARNELKTIHSEIIDKVPWWNHPGGGKLHREYWGHSKDWYYNGKVPREAIRNLAKKKNVSYNVAKKILKKNYFQGLSNGRELIAKEIKKTYPFLNRNETIALADQVQLSHAWGDEVNNIANQIRKDYPNITRSNSLSLAEEAMNSNKTIFEKNGVKIKKPTGTPRKPQLLKRPPSEALKAEYKISMEKAGQNNVIPEAFAKQPVNFERWKVTRLLENGKLKSYNPNVKNFTGIQYNNRDFIYTSTKTRAMKMLTRGESCIVPDELYEKIIKTKPEFKSNIVKESKITGKAPDLNSEKSQCAKDFEVKSKNIKEEIVVRNEKVLSKTQELYNDTKAFFFAATITAVMENWGYIKESYNGREEWGKTAGKVATDLAGYTCSMVAVRGALYYTPGINKIVGIAPNLRLGASTVIGIFIWKSGRQYMSFVQGETNQEELLENMKTNAEEMGMGLLSIPCSIVVTNILVASGAPGWIAGAVLIGGQVAFVKGKKWYDEEKWVHNTPINDLYAVLGPDYINKFTFINPEKHHSFLDNENHNTFAKPETHDSFVAPAMHYNMLNPEH